MAVFDAIALLARKDPIGDTTIIPFQIRINSIGFHFFVENVARTLTMPMHC